MTDERRDVNDVASDELRGLTSALDVLRETPTVSAAWRANLTTAVRAEAATHPIPARRGWSISMHPMLALAAGVTCIAVGAASARLVGRGLDRRAQSSAGTASSESAALRRVAAIDGGETFGVRFAIVAPTAQHVSVVGDFNGWDAQATPLVRSRDGSTWIAMLPMAAGRHTYAFVIDGDVVPDPAAPTSPDDDFGIPNSVLVVRRP